MHTMCVYEDAVCVHAHDVCLMLMCSEDAGVCARTRCVFMKTHVCVRTHTMCVYEDAVCVHTHMMCVTSDLLKQQVRQRLP